MQIFHPSYARSQPPNAIYDIVTHDRKKKRQSPPLHLIAGILDLGRRQELLLHRTHVDEPPQERRAARLVVGAAGPRPAKGLLSDNSSGALAVDIEVSSRVPQRVLREADRLPVVREHGAGERVLGRLVDLLADLGEGVGRSVVVDVGDEDGAEEFAGEEGVVRVRGLVDGGVDVVAL